MRSCRHFSFHLTVLLLSAASFASAQIHGSSDGKQIETIQKLSEVDEPPRVIRRIDPLIPFAAKRKNIEGKVTLKFVVTESGRVAHPIVLRAVPPDVFDSSSLKAILRWRFKPAIKDGKRVDVGIVVSVKFTLDPPRVIWEIGPPLYQGELRRLADLGSFHAESGMYEKAVKAYDQLIKLTPKLHGAYYNRGVLYGKWGKHRHAVKDFTKSIKLSPETVKYHMARAISFKELKKYSRACADLKSACDLGDCARLNLAKDEGVCKH